MLSLEAVGHFWAMSCSMRLSSASSGLSWLTPVSAFPFLFVPAVLVVLSAAAADASVLPAMVSLALAAGAFFSADFSAHCAIPLSIYIHSLANPLTTKQQSIPFSIPFLMPASTLFMSGFFLVSALAAGATIGCRPSFLASALYTSINSLLAFRASSITPLIKYGPLRRALSQPSR